MNYSTIYKHLIKFPRNNTKFEQIRTFHSLFFNVRFSKFTNGVINFYFAIQRPVKGRSATIKLIERLPACVSRKRINDAKSSSLLLKLIPNLTTLIDYAAAGTRLIIETSPDFDQRSTLPWLIPATMLTIRGRMFDRLYIIIMLVCACACIVRGDPVRSSNRRVTFPNKSKRMDTRVEYKQRSNNDSRRKIETRRLCVINRTL